MPDPINTRCCIAGGGPAGMMLGFLLARAGIDVVVSRKTHRLPARLSWRHDPPLHPGDHARAGLAGGVSTAAASETAHPHGLVGDTRVALADFTHLPTRCKFVALMPQWDFSISWRNVPKPTPLSSS
jgi:hypothetical protein